MHQRDSCLKKSRAKLKFGVVVFCWSLLSGLFIQKIALVYIFPGMNAGNGILVGGDSMFFHNIAADLALKIHQEGWSVWTLYPNNQPVAGILAIFYALFTPQPWVILPWNAFLHALAAYFLLEIFLHIFSEPKAAYLASLPLAFFPSAFTWTAQMHNENYAVLGSVLMLYSACLAVESTSKIDWKGILGIIVSGLIGAALLLMVRDYMYEMLFAFSTIFILLYLIVKVIREWIHHTKILDIFIRLLPLFVFLLIQTLVFTHRIQPFEGSSVPSQTPTTQTTTVSAAPSESEGDFSKAQWGATSWLPVALDEKIHEVIEMRDHQLTLFPNGATNVDAEVKFTNVLDVIKYIPRAFQLGFLSPFPSDWFSEGSKVTSRLMRLDSMVEMIIAYGCLLALPYMIWRKIKNPSLCAFLWVCSAMIITYAIGMPNIGTLYRFRYVFFTPLVGLGLSGWFYYFQERKQKKKLRLANIS